MTAPLDLLKALAAPFPPEAVDWRLGTMKSDKTKGMALAYIDARTVQDRLDAVCGAFWSCRHTVSGGSRVTCEIGVKIGDEWVFRSDGAGETDVEGEKGSYSDSFKRAAVKWGVGRYLYDLASPWVETEPMGKSFRIKDSEQGKLRQILLKDAGKAAVAAFGGTSSQAHAGRPVEKPAEPVDLQMVTSWRMELDRCESVNDVGALKRSDEFKRDWKAMNEPTRQQVQVLFTTHRLAPAA